MYSIDPNSENSLNDWKISADQLVYWGEHFLPQYEPFFIKNENIVNQLLNQGFIILTQAEFYDTYTSFYTDFGFVYDLWEIPYDTYVWICNSDQRAQVSSELLQSIFQEQIFLKRGQIYKEDELRQNLIPSDEYSSIVENSSNQFVYDHFHYLVLTFDLWKAFSLNVKNLWIKKWALQQIQDHPVHVKNIESISIHPLIKSRIKQYNGSFANHCGANCFAATLALASSAEQTESIIDLWLHQGPFLRSVQALNYRQVLTITDIDQLRLIESLDILIWINTDNQAIHASLCIAPDHVFTKMGQSWVQPWFVTTIASVFNYADVIQNGGQIKVYRKEEFMTV